MSNYWLEGQGLWSHHSGDSRLTLGSAWIIRISQILLFQVIGCSQCGSGDPVFKRVANRRCIGWDCPRSNKAPIVHPSGFRPWTFIAIMSIWFGRNDVAAAIQVAIQHAEFDWIDSAIANCKHLAIPLPFKWPLLKWPSSCNFRV